MPAVAGRCKRYFAYLCRVSRGDARDGLWLSIKPEAVKEIADGGIGACKRIRCSAIAGSSAPSLKLQTNTKYSLKHHSPQEQTG